ncbi:MAG TPA: CGNR zinc finger domain-containing protein [Pseudonocardia sp.]|uniref:CGNR zinc finger domain-containing protein n=1 Tax=Pseudonocardia sp. TaxID=60912 RepID=UPI002B4B77DB|nr:CGNR zinc finger domain-containing protein [Pseudonocardia sp.]HLU55261.1 CGNR zinc finger domain-containing protein [Pseudonocardia sp.]
MNTVWADRRGVHDDLGSVEQLGAWFARAGLAGGQQLGARRPRGVPPAARRDAPHRRPRHRRRPAGRAVGAGRPRRGPGDAQRRRRHLRAGPRARRDRPAPAAPALRPARRRPLPRGARAGRGAPVRRPGRRAAAGCHGPGCVLYFHRDHPRRGWCSAGCGNRARVARHYERHRRDR